MDNTYTVNIDALKTLTQAGQDDAVNKVCVTVSGTNQDGVSANNSRIVTVNYSGEEGYVPFNSLTSEIVLAWVSEDIDQMKKIVDQLIDQKQVSTIDAPVNRNIPWE